MRLSPLPGPNERPEIPFPATCPAMPLPPPNQERLQALGV
jgi:hypothetical protein